LRARLPEGERLAWAISPEPAAFEPEKPGIGRWETLGILGGGYATLAAVVAVVRTGQWLWVVAPIAVFALVGIGYAISRRIQERALRVVLGTVYSLTTRRALVVRTYPEFALLQELPIERIADISIVNKRGELADLNVVTTDAAAALCFRGVVDPDRARSQLLRIIRDPKATEQEMAAAAAYMQQMRQLVTRPAP
jgi:hypothetical protein